MAYHVSAYYEFKDLTVSFCEMQPFKSTNGSAVGDRERMSPRRLRPREKGEKVH